MKTSTFRANYPLSNNLTGLVLNWIDRKGLTRFTKRDAHVALQGYFSKAYELDPILTTLVNQGVLIEQRPHTNVGRGRPGSPIFEVKHATTT